jgi:UDP-glucose 4-epimerase
MRVGVTGSAGFIAGAVVRTLEAQGDTVVGLDRRDGNDIRTADLSAAFNGCDAVIHLAGVLGTAELFDNIDEAIDINIGGTLRVLRACREVGAGYVGITMHELFPSIYTATKIASQRLGSAFHNAFGVPVCHVRAFNAYGAGQAHGPGHPRKIIPAFACEGWSNRPLTIWGDGTQTVDLIDTDELARILVEATRIGDDAVIDAGTGTAHTVNSVAERVLAVTGSTAGTQYQTMRRGETPSYVCAAGAGWERLTRPPRDDMDALDATIKSYRDHAMVSGWAAP